MFRSLLDTTYRRGKYLPYYIKQWAFHMLEIASWKETAQRKLGIYEREYSIHHQRSHPAEIFRLCLLPCCLISKKERDVISLKEIKNKNSVAIHQLKPRQVFGSHCWNGILLFPWGLISLAGGVWPFRRSIEECLWLMFWSMVYLYVKLIKLHCLLLSLINRTPNFY